MAAPQDPKDKPVSLDLNLDQTTNATSRPKEPTQVKFRRLDVEVKKPEKSHNAATRTVRPNPGRPKAGKGKQERRRSKPLFIATGVAVTAVLVFQYLGGKEKAPAERARPAPGLAAKKPKDTVAAQAPREAPPPPVAVNDPYGQIRDASLDQLAPKVDENGNTFFSIRVAPKHVCHPADVEAMRIAVGTAGNVVISLEPMSDKAQAKTPISRTISLKEIMQGTQLTLPVNLKETGVYGIYVCTDEAGKRSCSGKPPADFNKILNHRELNVAANAVFYYQFAVLGLDYPTLYSGSPASIGGAREQLKEKKGERDWKPELDRAASIMREVKSYPPRTVREGRAIVLELPIAMVNPDGSCRS